MLSFLSLKSLWLRLTIVLLVILALYTVQSTLDFRERKLLDELQDLKYHYHFQSVPNHDTHDDRTIVKDKTLFRNVETTTPATKEAAIEALCSAHHFEAWKDPGRRFYDLLMVSSELDMLEIRMHTLAPYVDYFVIVETAKTFTGNPKPLVLQEKANWERFKPFHEKMIYKVVEDRLPYDEKSHWEHEIFLRNAMLTETFPGLKGTEKAAKKGDVILVSDLDELIRPETAMVLRYCDFPKRLTMHASFFYYSFSWMHRGLDWNHPQATTYGGSVSKTIMPEALRKELWDPRVGRSSPFQILTMEEKLDLVGKESAFLRDAGWHCSSCFDSIEQVVDKLNGFSHPEYNSKENRDPQTIINRYKHGLDLFGRPEEDFAFDKVLTEDIPEYVRKHATGRLQYLVDRNTTYAGFIDAEKMIAHPPP